MKLLQCNSFSFFLSHQGISNTKKDIKVDAQSPQIAIINLAKYLKHVSKVSPLSLSSELMNKFICNDNIKITSILKHMVYSYSKTIKLLKYQTFFKWRTNVIKIRNKIILRDSVYDRLFNDYKIKELMRNELEKKYNSSEGNKYPFTPTINHVTLKYSSDRNESSPKNNEFVSQPPVSSNVSPIKQKNLSLNLKLPHYPHNQKRTLYSNTNEKTYRSAKNIISYNSPRTNHSYQHNIFTPSSSTTNIRSPIVPLFNKPSTINSSFSTLSILSTRNKTKRNSGQTIVMNTPISTRKNNNQENVIQVNNNLNSSRPFINTSSSDAPIYLKNSYQLIQKDVVSKGRKEKRNSSQSSVSKEEIKKTNYNSKIDSISLMDNKSNNDQTMTKTKPATIINNTKMSKLIINNNEKIPIKLNVPNTSLNININNNSDIITHSGFGISNYRAKNVLEISSGVVSESVLNQNITKQNDILQSNGKIIRTEGITLQSLSDSKLFELANHYITTDESLDKYQCMGYINRKNK